MEVLGIWDRRPPSLLSARPLCQLCDFGHVSFLRAVFLLNPIALAFWGRCCSRETTECVTGLFLPSERWKGPRRVSSSVFSLRLPSPFREVAAETQTGGETCSRSPCELMTEPLDD